MPDLMLTLYAASDSHELHEQEGEVVLTTKKPDSSRVVFEFSILRTAEFLRPGPGEDEYTADWADLARCTFRQSTR